MECYCYLRNVQDLLSDGKTSCERRFGQPLKGPIIPFGSLIIIFLQLRRTSQESINLERKSYLDCSLDTLCTPGEFGRVTYWLQTFKELEQMDASELHARRLNAKEVSTPMSGEKFIFPIVDGTVKLFGGDQVLRTSTSIRDRPNRGEEQGNLQGESDGSSSAPHRDSSWYAGEARNDFWSISGNFIFRHHVEPRVKLHVPREESFPIPLKFIDVTRTADTSLDVLFKKKHR